MKIEEGDEEDETNLREGQAPLVPVCPDHRMISMNSQLDFDKIKFDLTTSRKGVLLLQALRWVSRDFIFEGLDLSSSKKFRRQA